MLGYAIGPLIFAPLSEIYGRSQIYHIGNIFYTLFSVGCALAPNIPALLIFRLLAGFVGGVPVTNAGGTIADMIPRHQRGLISSISNATILLAPTIAPAGGGFLSESQGWRWVFWLMTIMSGLVTAASFLILEETYSPVLLQRKATLMQKETGNAIYVPRNPEIPLAGKVWQAMRRPIVLLGTNPIVIIASIYLAIVYGVTYLLFTSIPEVFRNSYHWSEGSLGLATLGIGVGSLISLFLTGRYSDRLLLQRQQKMGDDHGLSDPRTRLLFLFPAAVCLPTGLILYGWTAQYQTHWILPIIGTMIFGMGMLFSFNSISTYLVDVFSKYAASALAAVSLVRCIAGGLVPLSGPDLYERMGYGWGNTLLGILAALCGAGTLSLWWVGERLRHKYSNDCLK
ncbi:hypothetical protein N7509_014071 [Penicillium cosmopolitanum]|uniref:Major facilitator superfamily (MFS) profile domain-containing protein n=1 Tax=Penicillium cosmopolitanum TaxID=1131564 RepID=A0A9W9V6G7_9EURO|nr:uncharacterized protein N7509_014071 [Penicillium cosmopolitanum]KAJ5369459.1 hypothetical protein N7509_014071 [Penicillium cosmopolitanum]